MKVHFSWKNICMENDFWGKPLSLNQILCKLKAIPTYNLEDASISFLPTNIYNNYGSHKKSDFGFQLPSYCSKNSSYLPYPTINFVANRIWPKNTPNVVTTKEECGHSSINYLTEQTYSIIGHTKVQ